MLDPWKIARRVKSLRQARGLKREEVAVKGGLSSSTVDNVEQGRAMPKIETLDRIAAALEVPLSTLLIDDGEAASRRPVLCGAAA